MTITESRFALGDKVFVLKKSKAIQMEIRSIIHDENGIHYSDNVALYIGCPYPERECFATMEELIKYVTSE